MGAKEHNCHAAAASDPSSEAWTTVLSHASASQSRLVCKLLQVSRSSAAAVHAQVSGRLSVQLTANSLARAQQFAAWVQRNGIILHDISVSFSTAKAGAWKVSAVAAAAADGAASAVSTGLALLAGTSQPAASDAEPAEVFGLRAFSAHGVPASSASCLTASLCGVASQLTHLELGMLLRMQPHHLTETAVPFSAHPAGLAALAGMTGLHTLLLHQPSNVDADVAGSSWPPLQDSLQQCIAGMKQLTRLKLPVHRGDCEALQLLQQCLPASLQELQLGTDVGVDQDEGALAFGVAESEEVLHGRQQHPFDLSHLTALTKLQLSACVPFVPGDALPCNLLQLRLRQCYDVQPLLQLSRLQALALRPSTLPASELMQLTQLTALTAVKLCYEGGYQQCEGFTHWSSERLSEQAAVWAKLPTVSLGLYEGSGPYEGGVFGPLTHGLSLQLQQLASLTSLTLDWPLEFDVLAGIGQLTQLQRLSLHWGWYDEYVGARWSEHTAQELAVSADIVLHVMHTFASLRQLRQLSWLCDEDRDMCLSLGSLKAVLQELGARGQPGTGRVSIRELAALVEPHLEDYDY